MSFFEYYFSDYVFNKKETAVCCPFPHSTSNGTEYYETNPSAHVNTEKGVFHCKVCDKGYSEVAFIAEVLGSTYEAATKIRKLFTTTEDIFTWTNNTTLSDKQKEIANQLGIDDSVIKELNIASEIGDELAFPVTMYGKIVDVRSYRPFDRANKIRGRVGSTNGMIIPFDLWVDTDPDRWTVICAGEKDMAVARSHKFNAITLTGGERALPKFINPFKNRRIAICYDNDEAGIEGANALAAYLQPYAKVVKVVTNFHEICKENGEDITDFFTKYDKKQSDLIEYIKDAPEFTAEEATKYKANIHPKLTLLQASLKENQGRVVQSNIQVVCTYENIMPVPTSIYARKLNSTGEGKGNLMYVGEERTWELNENTCQDILKLIDNNFTEEQIRLNTREILGITRQEQDVRIEKPSRETVYKCNVTDLFDESTDTTSTTEYVAYSLKHKLESGKKYVITYKLVPHPYKGQVLYMIILDAEEITGSVQNFVITKDTKQKLDKFRTLEGTVKERVELLTNMLKTFLKYNGFNKLIQAIDLSFHTVLDFNLGLYTNVRGYLDTIVVAESRVGKSSTAETLQKLYGLGTFASLAGNSATVPGLIGGSNKVSGSYQTRAGLIPMNHRGLIVFEELAKCNANIIRELTDIRSSNQVRIARVNGTLTLPAMVRMITLTNVSSRNGIPRAIVDYPNGIEILQELVGTPEDMARYDIMLIMGEQGNENEDFDPSFIPPKPFEQEDYRARIRWIWSRTSDQVIISEEVAKYIVERCRVLNKKYDSHIKIFGTEAWKKVSRLAIAVAGYLVSTDKTYEKIIVTKEHVNFACEYLVSCYDNPVFKLKEYVEAEKKYSEIDDEGVNLLQEIYNQNPSTCLQLESLSRTNKQNLMAASGLDNEMYNKLIQRMVQGCFIRFQGYDVLPTQKFRKGMAKIDRAGNIHKVGEQDA